MVDVIKNNLVRVEAVVLVLFLTFNIFPPFMAIPFYNYVKVIIFTLWLFLAFMRKKDFFLKPRGLNLFIVILSIYTVLIPILGANFTITNRYIDVLLCFSVIFLVDLYNCENFNINAFCIKIIYVFTIITCINTSIQVMLRTPYLARGIKSSGEYSAWLSLQGVGGYSFIYFISIFNIILLCLILNKNVPSSSKFKYFLCWIITGATIIISNFTTALAIVLILSAILLMFKIYIKFIGGSIYKTIIFWVSTSSVILVCILFFAQVVNFFANLFIYILPDGSNALKIDSFRNMILGIPTSAENSLDISRFQYIKTDFTNTFENPIFGIVVYPLEMIDGVFTQFGQHSFVFDTMILYGFPVVFCYIIAIIMFYKKYKITSELLVVAITFLSIVAFNNLTLSISVAAFYIFSYYHKKYFIKDINTKSAIQKIKYVGYYDTNANQSENRDYILAATNKMNYILEALSFSKNFTEIFSCSGTKNSAVYKGKNIDISENVRLKLPFTLGRSNKVRNVINRFLIKIQLIYNLLLNTESDDVVVVYHSLSYMSILKFAKKIKRFNIVLEVEEIYGDIIGSKKISNQELKFFNIADAYIFPTILLNDKVNTKNKPYVIVEGTYHKEEDRNCKFNDGKIHGVYAGTFEHRKGASTAIRTALHLDSKYHIHIIGFGKDDEKQAVIDLIIKTSNEAECLVTFDGLYSGEDYIKFLQSCDFGLSPQTPKAAYNNTSFPSKILSYLANGLRVVCINIPSIKASSIANLMYFFDSDEPEEIAKTIKNIDFSESYNSRLKIIELDNKFKHDLNRMLKNLKQRNTNEKIYKKSIY